MTDIAAISALLLIPLLTSVVKTDQRGLLTGLFLSLYFLSALHPVLALVPLAAAVTLFCLHRPSAGRLADCVIIKSPALPFFAVFLITMLVFCALSDAIFQYGSFFRSDQNVLRRAKQLSALAVVAGPLVFGRLCDRGGPFRAAIILSLCSELSVLMITSVNPSNGLFYTGAALLSLAASGFFTVLPLAASALQSQGQFLLTYPFLLPPAILIYEIARRMAGSRILFPGPGDFMFTLLLLSCLSAFFLFFSWKRRLTLVTKRRVS